LIRAILLRGDIRPVHTDELANLPSGVFTGFAPLRDHHDVVRVESTHPSE
jgi:hypothetical protein